MATYYYARHNITFRIVGFLRESTNYEVYHGKSTNPPRDIILHLRKTGEGRIYPGAKKIDEVKIKTQEPVGRKGLTREQVLPWDTHGVDLEGESEETGT